MRRLKSLNTFWAALFIISAGILYGCGAKPPVEGRLLVIEKIEPREVNGTTEITIEGNGSIQQYTSFQLTEPLRLVVDIPDATIGKFKERIAVNKGAIVDITPSQKDSIARLEIGLSQVVETKVYQAGGKLMVELAKPAAAEVQPAAPVSEGTKTAPEKAPAGAKERAPAQKAVKGTATVITGVKAVASRKGVRIIISGNGTIRPNTFLLDGKRLVIDIPGATSKVRPSVIPVRKGGVIRVRVGQHGAPDQKVRVVLDLARPMSYEAKPQDKSVVIALTTAPIAAKAEVKPAEEAAPPEQAAPAPSEAAPPAKKEKAAALKPEAEAAEAAAPPTYTTGKYTGRKISLDLQDADLVNVLRLFAEIANMNMIISPDVRGRVTIRVVNIPWDQAMDIILRMNGLGQVREDNIIRVASLGALAREAEEEAKTKEAKSKAEDLITRVLNINYTTASAIEATLKKSLSPRGEIVTDARTNTIIVKDIPKNVDDVVALLKLLDKPTPQVMIEARIVQANTNFVRDLGVQWGGKFTADAAHGNATGLTFPNSVTVTGGPSMEVTPSGSGNFFVNLPAAAGPGAGGAIGFTFGSLTKSLNLDLVLSAMESSGEGKIISTPRVSALDNKEAKIEQGESIPYTSTSAGGTQVQFVDAQLSLAVTPHVTPDNKIYLKIQAQKNAPDTSLLGANGQPSISKTQATTEILLSDGETAVIGGILVVDRGYTIQKVPFFGDLPLIGWLFREKNMRNNKTELLIFITPKVMRQETL